MLKKRFWDKNFANKILEKSFDKNKFKKKLISKQKYS